MVSSSEKDNRHICASVVSGVPSTIVKEQLPSEGSPRPSTTDFGMTVTAAPVSIFASIVRFCPVDGFSRLIYTYTCSNGALNFNRSMVSVFCSTFDDSRHGQSFGPPSVKIDVTEVGNDSFLFIHRLMRLLFLYFLFAPRPGLGSVILISLLSFAL